MRAVRTAILTYVLLPAGCAMEMAQPQDGVGMAQEALSTCGDGTVQSPEVCDDGNTLDDATCSADCTIDTSGTVCSEAGVQARIDAAASPGGTGAMVDLPNNSRIRICDTVVMDKRVHLRGNGTLFIVEVVSPSITAMAVEPAAGFSSIENLSVQYAVSVGGQDHDGVAIDVRAFGIRIDNVIMREVGTGIRAHSTLSPYVNVNGQQWRNISIIGCRRVGIDLDAGPDNQAGIFTGILVQGCINASDDAIALREAGYLGNTHIGHMLEDNDYNLWIENNANASTFVGVYVQGASTGINRVHVQDTASLNFFGGGLAVARRFVATVTSWLANGVRLVLAPSIHMVIPCMSPFRTAPSMRRFGGSAVGLGRPALPTPTARHLKPA